MLKQQSSRSHRSKGFKVKHALQVFVLAAVCVWLLYQVKHSHDKKIAMEERSNKLAVSTVDEDEEGISAGGNILKLGRKDLPNIHMRTDGGGGSNDSHDEDDGAEEVEDAEREEDNKQEESEEEDGRGGGDDDIDENDQERGDEEAEQGDELGEEDEEKERQQHDEANLLENNDHELDRQHAEANTQEAREVHYKEDDASSAVVKENEGTVQSETEHVSGEGVEGEHHENGDGEKHTENEEQTENGEVRQAENEEQIENGEVRQAENGEQTKNGEARQVENGGQTENGEARQTEEGGQTENGEARQTDNGEQSENGGQNAEGEKKEAGEATKDAEDETKDNISTVVTDQGAENSDAAHEDGQVEQQLGTSSNATGTILLEKSDQVGDAGSSNSTLIGSSDQAEQQVESEVEVSSNATASSVDNPSEKDTMSLDTKDVGLQLQNETIALGTSTDLNSTQDTQTAVEDKHPGESMAEKGDDGPREQVITEGSEERSATNTTDGQQQEESSTNIPEGQEQEESSTTSSTGENKESVLPVESTNSTANPDDVTDEEKDARTDLSTLPEIQTDSRSVEDIAAE